MRLTSAWVMVSEFVSSSLAAVRPVRAPRRRRGRRRGRPGPLHLRGLQVPAPRPRRPGPGRRAGTVFQVRARPGPGRYLGPASCRPASPRPAPGDRRAGHGGHFQPSRPEEGTVGRPLPRPHPGEMKVTPAGVRRSVGAIWGSEWIPASLGSRGAPPNPTLAQRRSPPVRESCARWGVAWIFRHSAACSG